MHHAIAFLSLTLIGSPELPALSCPDATTAQAGAHSYCIFVISSIAPAAESLVLIFDEQGNYDPYGKVTIYEPNATTVRAASAVGNALLWQGGRLDGESGLYYKRARMYSTELGRWVSRDPLEYPDGFNMYMAYMVPNALDPLGLDGAIFFPNASPQVNEEIRKTVGGDGHNIVEGAIVMGSMAVGLMTGGSPLLASLGSGPLTNMAIRAFVGGAAGDASAQVAQVAIGDRARLNLAEIIDAGGLSMALSMVGYGIVKSGQWTWNKLKCPKTCPKPAPEPTPTKPNPYEELAAQIREIERRRALGMDPFKGSSALEEQAAVELERRVGTLTRDKSGTGDWIDGGNRSYDAVGPVPEKYDFPGYLKQIDKHLLKQGLDQVVVDTAGLTAAEKAAVDAHIAALKAAEQARIIKQCSKR